MIDQYGFVFPNRFEPHKDFDEIGRIQIELCEIFIKQFCKRLKHISKGRSSYGYKHDVEKWCGRYVSSGAFSKAMENLGFKLEFREHHSYANISLNHPSYYCYVHNYPGKFRNEGVPEKYQMEYSGYWDQNNPWPGSPWKSKNPKYYEDLMEAHEKYWSVK